MGTLITVHTLFTDNILGKSMYMYATSMATRDVIGLGRIFGGLGYKHHPKLFWLCIRKELFLNFTPFIKIEIFIKSWKFTKFIRKWKPQKVDLTNNFAVSTAGSGFAGEDHTWHNTQIRDTLFLNKWIPRIMTTITFVPMSPILAKKWPDLISEGQIAAQNSRHFDKGRKRRLKLKLRIIQIEYPYYWNIIYTNRHISQSH